MGIHDTWISSAPTIMVGGDGGTKFIISNLWGTLANLLFFGAGMFSDLILIRFCLLAANIFLLLNALSTFEDGIFSPAFPHGGPFNGGILFDVALWAVICTFLHGNAFARHILDEKEVKVNPENEDIWRFFWRRCGMGPAEFNMIIAGAQRKSVKAGDIIVGSHNQYEALYLVLDGIVTCYYGADKDDEGNIYVRSGEVFQWELGNVFNAYVGFFRPGFYAKAQSDVNLIFWPAPFVLAMATAMPPAIGEYWRLFFLNEAATQLEVLRLEAMPVEEGEMSHRTVCTQAIPMDMAGPDTVDHAGEHKNPAWLMGKRAEDFVRELDPDELPPKNTWHSFWMWIWNSVGPFPPPFLRHRATSNGRALAQLQKAWKQFGKKSVHDRVKSRISVASTAASRVHARSIARSQYMSVISADTNYGDGADPVRAPAAPTKSAITPAGDDDHEAMPHRADGKKKTAHFRGPEDDVVEEHETI